MRRRKRTSARDERRRVSVLSLKIDITHTLQQMAKKKTKKRSFFGKKKSRDDEEEDACVVTRKPTEEEFILFDKTETLKIGERLVLLSKYKRSTTNSYVECQEGEVGVVLRPLRENKKCLLLYVNKDGKGKVKEITHSKANQLNVVKKKYHLRKHVVSHSSTESYSVCLTLPSEIPIEIDAEVIAMMSNIAMRKKLNLLDCNVFELVQALLTNSVQFDHIPMQVKKSVGFTRDVGTDSAKFKKDGGDFQITDQFQAKDAKSVCKKALGTFFLDVMKHGKCTNEEDTIWKLANMWITTNEQTRLPKCVTNMIEDKEKNVYHLVIKDDVRNAVIDACDSFDLLMVLDEANGMRFRFKRRQDESESKEENDEPKSVRFGLCLFNEPKFQTHTNTTKTVVGCTFLSE